MNNLLTNREWSIEGNWLAPRRFLESEFKSVIHADYINQSSSAGDWQGLFIQELNGWSYIIPFEQENNWPGGSGFTLRTGEVFIKTKQSASKVMRDEAIKMFCLMYY